MSTPSPKKPAARPLPARRAALIAAAIGLLAVIAYAAVRVSAAGTIRVGFYAISDAASGAVAKVIRERLDAEGSRRGVAFATLDGGLPLREALRRRRGIDIVFAYDGRNLEDMIEARSSPRARAVAPEAAAGLTSSMRKLALREGEYRFVPLLIDHFEMDCGKSWLSKTVGDSPTTMDGLFDYLDACARAAKRGRGSEAGRSLQWSLFFAGADSERLLQMTGAYVESAWGIGACRALGRAIGSGASFEAVAGAPLDEERHELADALKRFRSWVEGGYMHPQWNTLSERDLKQLMKMGLAPAAFMTLSDHRGFDASVIGKFEASRFPSSADPARRSLTAPVLCGILLGKSAYSRDLLTFLSSDGAQSALSMASGLAPAAARATAPDRESDDVRYWVAASEPPYPGLDKDAFRTPAERAAFAGEIVRVVNGPAE